MADEPEVIRDQMQDTRTALTEKLEALEHQVTQTVQNTTSAVTDTVQSVKDAVQNTVDTVSGAAQSTVETVKETFNLSRHVQEHPWMAMLGSVAVGYVAGRLLSADRDDSQSMGSRMAASQYQPAGADQGPERRGHNGHRKGRNGAEQGRKESESSRESWLGGLVDTYRDEVNALKSLGIAAVVGVVRDLVKQNVQGEIGSRLGEWMNGLTQKLGGKPLSEPVLATDTQEGAAPPAPSTAHAHKPGKGGSKKGQQNLGPMHGR